MTTPRIGLAWGPHAWSEPPKRVNKLLSMGAVRRNLQHALESFADVRPWTGPENPTAERLDRHLADLHILVCDAYTHSFRYLERRLEADHSFRALILANGNMPKAGDPLLTLAPHLIHPGDGIMFTSSADRAIFRRLVESHHLVEAVVPLPVDRTTFHPIAEPADVTIRQRFGLPAGRPLLLYVGRLNIQKNLHGLLHLLHDVRHTNPEVHLAIVGETDDIGLAEFQVPNTGYTSYLHALARGLDVDSAVHLVGPAFGDDLGALYRTADLVVNLGFYHRENFGLSQAEAQACGTAVICSAWGGFRDVAEDGHTGILVDASMTRHGIRVNWADAADAVSDLLSDRRRLQHMGSRAAEHAAAQFSIEVFSERLRSVASRLATAPSTAGTALRPSDLATSYLHHGNARGWSDPHADGWEPPMYSGDDYAIYRSLLEPYCSSTVDLDASDIALDATPVRAGPWTLDHDRRRLTHDDPIWPHQKFLSAESWNVALHLDGARTVRDIADEAELPTDAVQHAVARLHREGFVLLRAPRGPAPVSQVHRKSRRR